MKRVDIHFHVIPGVDDGPSSMDQSIDLAAAAAAERTGTIVATPHVREEYASDVGELADRLRELRERLRDAGVEVELELGAELGHTMVARLRQRELETIALGPPGSRWLLVESPLDGFAPDFTAATDELRDRGFAVVVAHPERAAGDAAEREAALAHELAAGSVLQLNAWSLAGRHGGEPQAIARRLLIRRARRLADAGARARSRPRARCRRSPGAVRRGGAATASRDGADHARAERGLSTRVHSAPAVIRRASSGACRGG